MSSILIVIRSKVQLLGENDFECTPDIEIRPISNDDANEGPAESYDLRGI